MSHFSASNDLRVLQALFFIPEEVRGKADWLIGSATSGFMFFVVYPHNGHRVSAVFRRIFSLVLLIIACWPLLCVCANYLLYTEWDLSWINGDITFSYRKGLMMAHCSYFLNTAIKAKTSLYRMSREIVPDWKAFNIRGDLTFMLDMTTVLSCIFRKTSNYSTNLNNQSPELHYWGFFEQFFHKVIPMEGIHDKQVAKCTNLHGFLCTILGILVLLFKLSILYDFVRHL